MPRPASVNGPSIAPAAPEWGDLQFFLAMCAELSIAGAARRLAVDHSTVLRRLARLQRTLGVPLFDRNRTGYALSPAGKSLADRLAGLSETVDAACQRVAGSDQRLTGAIRITTTDTLAGSLLMPLLQQFMTIHPGVRLQLLVNNTLMSLPRREADVAIRGSNEPPENLVGRRVGIIRTAVYAARSYLKRVPKRTPLPQHDWVAPDDSLAHLVQARWLRQHVPAARIALRADSLLGMVDAVRAGFGVAWLLTPLADACDDLVQVAPPEPVLDTGIWVLSHPDLRRVARVRVFTQFLHDRLSADARLMH